MTTDAGYVAQYYELTLRVRFQGGKWTVVILGPRGLIITHDANYGSETEAEQVAIGLAQKNLHEEKHDVRPLLEVVGWQPA